MNIQHIHGVPPLYTNTFLIITNAKHGILIDAAAEPGVYLKALDEAGATLTHILLTHGHYDHTTAVPQLHKALPQAEIYIHRADANGAGSQLFPLAGQIPDLKFYDEGDALALGDMTIQVLHTPGHSKGSVTLKVGDVLFCGDTLFAGSCGRTDLAGGSYAEIMASLKKLSQRPGDYHVCPGHDVTSTLERERQYNPFLREAMGQRS